MAAKQTTTWIVVLDGKLARFFVLRRSKDGQVFEEAASVLAAKRAGRGEKPGRAAGKARGALEPRSDVRKLEKYDLAREVADALDDAVVKGRFSQLVLVAPPRSLGALRALLTERVLALLAHEIPKSLTKFAPDALWMKLSSLLVRAATPVPSPTRAKAKAAAKPGPIPATVVFRNMEGSPAVRDSALKLADKLSRKFLRVEKCKITVEVPHRRNLKGRIFRVDIDVSLHGAEITTKGVGEGKHAHQDAHTALRDAFEAVERQLRDYTDRKSSGAGSRRKAPLRGRVVEEEE